MRKRPGAGAWLALALQIIGLTAAVLAVWRGSLWSVMAALGGVALAFGWTIRWRPGRLRRRGPPPLGLREVLDLLRQAYGATVGWGVDATEGAWEVVDGPDVAENRRRRGAALVQLASVDGRQHVVRDPDATFIAVGDFPYGAGLALDGADHDLTMIEAVAQALRRFVAGMRLAEEQSAVPRARVLAGRVARLVAGAQTLDGMARATVELGEQITHRAVALVIAAVDGARIVAVSTAADRRLAGVPLSPESPVARTLATGIPVATRGSEDVFGPGVPERRRSERAGTAYPLMDVSLDVVALVLLGPPLLPFAPVFCVLGAMVIFLGRWRAAARA